MIAGGTLRLSPTGRPTRFVARDGGAIITANRIDGPLDVALRQLTVANATSDIVIDAVANLDVLRASSGTGNVTITSAQGLRVGQINPVATGNTTLTAEGDLVSNGRANLTGAAVVLTSNNGAILGEGNAAFRFSSDEGTVLTARSDGDMLFENTKGDLRLGRLQSGSGDISVLAARDLILSDNVTAGKGEALTLSATRSIVGQGGFTVGRTIALNARLGSISDGAGGALRFSIPTTATLSAMAAKDIAMVLTGGNVTAGTIAAGGDLNLTVENGALLTGRVSGLNTTLTAATGIGVDKFISVAGGPVRAKSGSGDLRLLFEDSPTATVNEAATTGMGRLELMGSATALTIGDAGVTGGAQAININVASLTQNAGIISASGDISIATAGNMTMLDATAPITANAGSVTLKVGGNLTTGIITAKAESRRALDVNVVGDVLLAPRVIGARFIADAFGSDARIRMGRSTVVGPLGLETRIARLDIEQARGDLHLNNQRALRLIRGVAETGMLDVFAGGQITFDFVKAGDGKKLILASRASIEATNGVIEADDVGLYAFGGSVQTNTTTAATIETRDGAILRLFARNRIAVKEKTGDLTVALAVADNLGVDLDTPGNMTVGVIGSGTAVNVSAGGNLVVNRVGRASVQLEDAVALGLVRPDLYGTLTAQSPSTLALSAQNNLTVGIASAGARVDLIGRSVTAVLSDATPINGLSVGLTAPGGKFADQASLRVIGGSNDVALADPLSAAASSLASFGNNFDGTLTLDGLRIGKTNGVTQIGTGASRLVVKDTRIAGDVRFTQRDFNLLAQRFFTFASETDDVQVITQEQAFVDFEVTNGRNFVARNLNIVNDVTQSQTSGSTIREIVETLVVLAADETIVSSTFIVQDDEEKEGTSAKALTLLSVTIRGPRGERVVRLPLTLAGGAGPAGVTVPG